MTLSNNVQYKDDYHTQLQIIPVNVSSRDIKIKTSASTLISKCLSEKLSLDEEVKHLTMSNIMNMKNNFQSKLVTLQVSSNAHPEHEHIDISNA